MICQPNCQFACIHTSIYAHIYTLGGRPHTVTVTIRHNTDYSTIPGSPNMYTHIYTFQAEAWHHRVLGYKTEKTFNRVPKDPIHVLLSRVSILHVVS